MFVLGVYLDGAYLREALLQKRAKKIEVRSLQATLLSDLRKEETSPLSDKEKNLEGSSHVKPLYMSSFSGKIVTGVSAKDSLIRTIELKVNRSQHVEEAIAFQLEATSYLPAQDMLSVPLISVQKKGTEATLFTLPKTVLKHHLLEMQQWQIDPDAVSSIPEALCQFALWKFPSLTDAFIIHFGSHEWICAWLEKGRLKKAHSIPGGIEALLASLFEDRKKILLKTEVESAAKQIDLLFLKSGFNPHLTAKLTELRQEFLKVQYSFERNSEKKPLLFTGRTDAFIHLSEFLSESQESSFPLTLEEQKFAIPIGLALSQLSPHPLQLRREEFFPRKNWRKMGLYALSLLTASSLLSGLLLLGGLRLMQSHKEKILHSLQSLAKQRNIHLEGTSIEEKIDRWIAIVETHNKEYPYIVQVPKVAEVLAWLSALPFLEELKKEGDPIEIREMRYQLVQFPHLGSLKEPYQAKVELSFKFKSPMNARRFHEELRKGLGWIQTEKEISWDASSEGYRTSFFLKRRTPHAF